MSDTDAPRLPLSPDLEQERKRAKELLKAVRAGDAAAVARLRSHHPRFARMPSDALQSADVKLSDAQWVIAREYGFASWPAFRARIDARASDGPPPLNEESETAAGGIFSCRYERHLKSLGGAFPASVTFSNMSPRNISTFWLDHNGERVAYRTLASGYSYMQQTFVSHPWVVVDAAGRCLGIVLPGGSTRNVTVTERSITAGGGGADIEEKQETLYCSFCGKSQHEVKKLIAGPKVFICDECVGLCDTIVEGPDLTPERAAAAHGPRADAVPTELLLLRLRTMNAVFERQRADVEDTVNMLRQRDVSWAAMGDALGVSPQAAQDLFSRLSALRRG